MAHSILIPKSLFSKPLMHQQKPADGKHFKIQRLEISVRTCPVKIATWAVHSRGVTGMPA